MSEFFISLSLYLGAILTAPFLMAVILRVKAFFAGKQGPSLFIKYQMLVKLLQKGSVYSESTSFIFRFGPLFGLSSSLAALAFLPVAGMKPLLSFQGDMIFVCYLFALARFFTISAALDTASPFEGMGAAREAMFGMLAEATVFLTFILFSRLSGEFSLSGFLDSASVITVWQTAVTYLVLVIPAILIVLVVENARVPVDDPATHLELTMIHEVMILDHSGPDLGFIEAGVFCKMFFYTGIIADLLLPGNAGGITQLSLYVLLMLLLYAVIGTLESVTARLKMNHAPKFILTSFALVFFALILSMEAPL